MAAKIRWHHEYAFRVLKNGKRGKSYVHVGAFDICPVVQCDRCRRYGSPVWIRAWYFGPREVFDPLGSEDAPYEREPSLCMGCLNQLRPHWKAQHHIIENERLIRRIKREITRVNSENRRGTTGIPG